MSTARRLIVSASALIGRQVKAQELWDVGEDEPLPQNIATGARPVLSEKHRMALKTYDTRLDRVLRAEGLLPCFFAVEAGMTRQSLQRLRAAGSEPCMSTVAEIVRTLRRMTGKPYKAHHVFDVGEKLSAEDPLAKRSNV